MNAQENLAGVLDFLNGNYDVFYETLKTMRAPLLAKWASVSKELRRHVQNEFRRRYNVSVRDYVSDVPAFSRVVLSTRTVISGSHTLPFIDPSNMSWFDEIKDLDLYTCHAHGQRLVDYLMEREGYEIVKERSRISDAEVPDEQFIIDYAGEAIHSVYALERSRDGRRIDVVISFASYCSTLPIFQFHSSIVMNFFTPTLLFVGYPQFTFDKRGLINIDVSRDDYGFGKQGAWNVTDKFKKILEKYELRGFTLAFTPWVWDDHHNVNCRFGGDCTGPRRTNDGQCLIDMSTVYDDGLAYFYDGMLPGGQVEWSLGGTDCVVTNGNDTDIEIVYPAVCFHIPG